MRNAPVPGIEPTRVRCGRRAVWLRALAGLTAAAATLASPGCAIEDVLSLPDCDEGGTALLVAQSVPGAELVPCFDVPLPAGWIVESVRIDQDGTVATFGSDRAGDEAAVFHYTRSCDVGDGVLAASEHEGAARYDAIELVGDRFVADRFYLFGGGCIRWEFDFDGGASAALSIELGDHLHVVTRDDLNRSLRDSFLDEEV